MPFFLSPNAMTSCPSGGAAPINANPKMILNEKFS